MSKNINKPTSAPKGHLEVIKMSRYNAPTVTPVIGDKVMWGENNNFFNYIEDCYNNSPTNNGIINGIVSYTFGEGLINLNNNEIIKKFITRNDAKLIVSDYYLYGQASVQVIWNDADGEYKKPLQIKHIPIKKLALDVDEYGETIGYWFCFDWSKNGSRNNSPRYFYKFDGIWKGYDNEDIDPDVEILSFRRPSSGDDFFSKPKYYPGLVEAKIESELANWGISHIQNGFQGTTIINVNSVPETNEAQEEMTRGIINSVTGSGNASKTIVSFNINPEDKIEVDKIQWDNVNEQYEKLGDTAVVNLIKAHNAPPMLFSGTREGGGLGSNKDELVETVKDLYRNVVYSLREEILDNLQFITDFIYDDVVLEFKDFELGEELENDIEKIEENE